MWLKWMRFVQVFSRYELATCYHPVSKRCMKRPAFGESAVIVFRVDKGEITLAIILLNKNMASMLTKSFEREIDLHVNK